MKARGFTLLEVMVAIAILGLGLSVILGSQAGLFASALHAEHITHAVSLARCKMSETELELLTEGYPLVDQSNTGRCCEDDDSDYRCEWRVEIVELPQPQSFLPEEEGGVDAGAGDGPSAGVGDGLGTGVSNGLGTGVGDGLGALGALNNLGSTESTGELGTDPLEALASLGAGDSPGGGIGAMVMGLVYPDLKPMLEASIRKLTVIVRWREGGAEKDLRITQYVTDPQQGGLLLEAEEPVETEEP